MVRLLVPTAVATTSAVLPGFLIGSQAVQLAPDLGIALGTAGAAVAVAWLTASALSAVLGRLAERLGGARGLRIGALTSAAAMLWIAVAGRSFALLAVGAALGGAGNALAQPSANVVIARGLPPERHGLGFGVKQAAIPMATVLGGLAVPALTLTLGWRATFVAGAALAVGAAVALPSRATAPAGGGAASGEASDRGLAGTGPRADETADGAAVAPPPDPRRRRALVVLGTGVGFGAAAAGALSSFLVGGAVDAGMAEGRAGLLLTVGSLIGIAVRLTMGVRADRVGGDQLPLVAGMMLTGSAAVACFALAAVPVYVLATPVAFGAGWAWPGLFNLSVVRRFPEAPGAATGATQTGTYLGAGVGPLVFGLVVDARGFSVAWPLAAVLLALGATTMAVGRRLAEVPAGAAPAIDDGRT